MSKVFIPQGYRAPLSVYELQRAIEFIKSNFQTNLSNALNLRRVSAPLFVEEASGGVRDLDTLLAMYGAGCDRFGLGVRTSEAILQQAQRRAAEQ